MRTKILLLICLQIISAELVDITFKNVKFRGYRTFTPKFRPTILSGNNLKDYLPNRDFDTLEFVDQNIPVLYKNSISDINEVTELIIESCKVEEIRPGAFRNLPNLQRLSLKVNKIRFIENGIFNNLSIHTLDLSYNQIENIYGQAFNNMPHLYYINLAYNNIPKWNSDWFKNTPELSIIFFKNNLIEELPANSFKNFNSNSIKVRNINLIFSNNKISKINPLAFSDLKRINQLMLNNNFLQNFDKNVLKYTTVNDLRLNNNSISCFSEDDFDDIFKGPSVYIEYNPFDCECIEKIQKWTKKHNNKNLGINELKCDKDEDKDEENLKIIDIQEIGWGKTSVDRITLVLSKN